MERSERSERKQCMNTCNSDELLANEYISGVKENRYYTKLHIE